MVVTVTRAPAGHYHRGCTDLMDGAHYCQCAQPEEPLCSYEAMLGKSPEEKAAIDAVRWPKGTTLWG